MKYFLCLFFFLAYNTFLSGQVSIQTKIPAITPNNEVTIEIKINKGSVANFAKFQLDVPEGVLLSEGDNKTGSFTFENNRAKIIWVTIPTEPEFVVTMRLNSGTATGVGTINQKFYYLENGIRKEVEAMPIAINFGGNEAVITTNTSPVQTPETAAVETSASTATQTASTSGSSENTVDNAIVERVSQPIETENPSSERNKNTSETSQQLKEKFDAANETTSMGSGSAPAAASPASASVNGVTYKVQIGAFSENPGMAKFSALKDVKIITEGNYYKVMVGNYTTKEEAIKAKEEFMAKGFQGFVVTFQNGLRVR